MKRYYLFVISVLTIFFCKAKQPVLLFDLSHGQFQDTFFDPSYYDYVIPGYKEILTDSGIEYKEVKDSITPEILSGTDVLLILSPLSRSTQIPIKDSEKKTIIDYINNGGSVIMMVDEESHRVILDEYGANDITEPFGIYLGEDIEDVPGNWGAISFINEIFSDRLEVPYSGSRHVTGGIPASVCMEGGQLHGTYAKL